MSGFREGGLKDKEPIKKRELGRISSRERVLEMIKSREKEDEKEEN